ncbi:hypothetical protein OGZ01_28885 [Vibrio harveyi]|nr:hypothetical protein [Vibrio harveyi]
MPFIKLANYRDELTAQLENIAHQFQLHSLLIMESKPDQMVVFAANEQPIYHVGDAGPKNVINKAVMSCTANASLILHSRCWWRMQVWMKSGRAMKT